METGFWFGIGRTLSEVALWLAVVFAIAFFTACHVLIPRCIARIRKRRCPATYHDYTDPKLQCVLYAHHGGDHAGPWKDVQPPASAPHLPVRQSRFRWGYRARLGLHFYFDSRTRP